MKNKPKTLTVLPENILRDWKTRKRWACFQWEEGENGRPIKMPINPVNGKHTWSTKQGRTSFDLAYGHYSADTDLDGLCFCIDRAMGYVVIDLDGCRDPETDIIEAWARTIIDRFNTRTELSTRATDVHLIMKGEKKVKRKDYYIDGHKVEVIDTAPLVVTGHLLEGMPIEPIEAQDVLDDFIGEATHGETTVIERGAFSLPKGVGFQRISDDEVVAHCRTGNSSVVFCALYYDGDVSVIKNSDDSVADFALLNEIAFWANGCAKQMERIFKGSALYRNPGRADKWAKAISDTTYGAWTIESVLRYRIAKGGSDPGRMFYTKRLPANKNLPRLRR